MRIAIVNDLALAREVLRRLVHSVPGHAVAWMAENGEEAVRKAAQDRPDIILMDLQYAPMVLRSPYYSKMEAIIAEVARQEKIGFFSRFALMRKSIEAGVSPGALVSWDGLHHTADGYNCIGRALARSVSNGVP